MKIFIVCLADMSASSGSQIRARLFVDGFSRLDWEVAAFSTGFPSEYNQLPFELFRYDWREELDKSVSRVLDQCKPDVTLVVTEAGADTVCRLSKQKGIPCIFDVHGLGFVEVLELGPGYGPRLKRCMNSLRWLTAVFRADMVFALSPTLLPILKWFNRKTYYVNGMTDTDLFSPEKKAAAAGTSGGRVRVLYAGNFSKWQGVEQLIEAIGLVNNRTDKFEFTLVGPVVKNQALVDRWKKALSADNVCFHDSVDYYDMPDFLQNADVLVIPRPFMLSSYLAVPQKMGDFLASGKTVIASDLKSHRKVLNDGESGILCPATPEGIAEAICQTQEVETRRHFESRARSLAMEAFSHIKVCSDVEKMILGLLR